jgi:hypothetical protein
MAEEEKSLGEISKLEAGRLQNGKVSKTLKKLTSQHIYKIKDSTKEEEKFVTHCSVAWPL